MDRRFYVAEMLMVMWICKRSDVCREQWICISSGYQVDTWLFLPQSPWPSARGRLWHLRVWL